MTFYEQIQKAINYIEKNINKDISYEEVANESYMSVASFYRYFNALTGFTYKEYVRKRRLAYSLSLLQENNHKIIDIAFETCFESHEAFSRAFKREYGMNPSEFRKSRRSIRGIKPKILVKEYFMGIIIKELPDMKVAYYRVISKTPENDAWNHLKKWAEGNKIFNKAYRIFGFNNPSPEEMKKITDKKGNEYFIHIDNSEYGYEFVITVDDNALPENNGKGVDIKTIPGGKYAIMSIGVGCEEHDIEKGWGKFSKLLKENNYKTTGRCFEEHLEFNPLGKNDNFRMDLYVEIE